MKRALISPAEKGDPEVRKGLEQGQTNKKWIKTNELKLEENVTFEPCD